MKKVILIFGVLSLLIFIRPVLGFNKTVEPSNTASLITEDQTDDLQEEGVYNDALRGIKQFYNYTGFANATSGNLIMILIGIIFIYLGIKFDYEPLLLIPIGAGVILGNIPFVPGNQTGIYETGSVLNYLYFGVVKGIYPPLIFLGIGAMTDFSSLIANPKLMLLGAAAQIGVFATFLGALYLGFNLPEAGAIGIIGGADGPTAIFLSSKLANGVNFFGTSNTASFNEANDFEEGSKNKNETTKSSFPEGKDDISSSCLVVNHIYISKCFATFRNVVLWEST